MGAGRPTLLSSQNRDTIIDMLCVGDSVAKIAKAIDSAPSTIFRWIDTDQELLEIYARAKQCKAQVLAEEVIEIADDPELKPDDKRIRVEARKWVAGKYYGKLFADRTQIEHSGKVELTSMDDQELDRLIAERQQQLAKAEQG